MTDDDKTHSELMAYLGGFVPEDEPLPNHTDGSAT